MTEPGAVELDDDLPALDGTIDPARLVSFLRAAGVRDLETGAASGRHGYEVRLAQHVARLAAKRGQAPPWAVRSQRAILARVAVLFDLRPARSASAWADALARILRSGPFSPRRALLRRPLLHPEEDAPPPLERAASEALALAQQAYAALLRLLADLAQARLGTDLRLGAGAARGLLQELAREISLNPSGGRGAAVRILPVRQLVGADYDHVFLPHLNEGVFPRPPRPDPLLRDADRVAFDSWRRREARRPDVLRAFRVEEAPLDEPGLPVRRQEEVLLFCLGVAAARRRAHLSWATRDGAGRPLLPSILVDAVRRVTGAPVHTEPLEILPDFTRLVNADELLHRCLAAAAPSATADGDPIWLEAARQLWGGLRTADAVIRTRVELSRRAFFEQLATEAAPAVVGPYLGQLEPAGRDAAQALYGPEKPLSASRIDHYGVCPARFFFEDLLRIEDEDEVGEQLDNLTTGALLQRCVERLYDDLMATGATQLDAGAGDFPDRVARALDAAFADVGATSPLGHGLLRAVTRRRLVRQLVTALRAARTADKKGRTALPASFPYRQELGFGHGGLPALVLDLGPDIGSVSISGRIDRIDRTAPEGLCLTDYKAGGSAAYRKKLSAEHLNRTDFQLTLYAAAAREILGERGPVSVQYVSLKDGGQARLDWDQLAPLLEQPSADGESPDTLTEGLRRVVGGIRAGQFTAATQSCRFCGVWDACRVSPAVRDADS